MEAHPRRLKSVFRQDVRLVVPLFQRPYVWEAETQWRPLWEDLLATLERKQHGDDTPHFLGAVVLQLRRGPLGGIEVREVIDGQQRLTTLQLLIAAVADAFAQRGLEGKTVRRLAHLLFNDADLIDGPDEEHKLWPTNRDRSAYRDVMSGVHKGGSRPRTKDRIVEAYTWFRDVLDGWLAAWDSSPAEDALNALAEVLLEYLEVVVIDLGEDDNAQIIFETLNARGTPLRAADLIKNLVFRTLQDHGRPVEQLYARHWEQLEETYWQEDVRQGRLKRPRVDAFVGHFLTVFTQDEVLSHNLFTASRRYVGSSPDRAEEFLREVSRYAGVYRSLDQGASPVDEERAALARLAIVDTQTIVPLLLWLFAHTDGPERTRAIRAIESFVVRRTVCRMTAANYNRMFLELLKRLGAGEQPVGVVVEEHLASQRSSSGMWPSDADVRRAFEDFQLYRLLKRDQLQRVLLALDAHAASSKTEPIQHYAKLSLEHLMPQQWADDWPLPPDEVSAEIVAEERQVLLHTIGNLALVTGSLNSALSNGAWAIKRHEILKHSALTLNRGLPEDWNNERIRERSRWLADLAIDLWARPETDAPPAQWIPEPAHAEVLGPTAPRSDRGDIGAHVEEAFRHLPVGAFLSIAEIRRAASSAYPDALPSAGAISARLFPASGRPTTIPGVRPDTSRGIRGAVRL